MKTLLTTLLLLYTTLLLSQIDKKDIRIRSFNSAILSYSIDHSKNFQVYSDITDVEVDLIINFTDSLIFLESNIGGEFVKRSFYLIEYGDIDNSFLIVGMVDSDDVILIEYFENGSYYYYQNHKQTKTFEKRMYLYNKLN